MAIVQVNFNKKINSSLQVGDVAYVSEIKSAAGGIVDDPELVGITIYFVCQRYTCQRI